MLGLPSSGGTIPLEATPSLYRWLGEFEPMHQIYRGVRAIIFFGASGDAGLIHAVWMTFAGLVIGLVVGPSSPGSTTERVCTDASKRRHRYLWKLRAEGSSPVSPTAVPAAVSATTLCRRASRSR